MALEKDRIESKIDSLQVCYHSLDKKVEVLSERVSDHLEQDSLNLEKITESLSSINQSLHKYNEQLEIHIRRCDALEASNEIQKQQLEVLKTEIQAQMTLALTPIRWANQTKDLAKWITAVGGAVAVLFALIRFLK